MFLNLAQPQGYSCGDNYQSLGDIPSLNEIPPPSLSQSKRESIEKELLKDFALKSFEEVGDLSSKVSFRMIMFLKRCLSYMPLNISNTSLWEISQSS